jgi:hypothetical protein
MSRRFFVLITVLAVAAGLATLALAGPTAKMPGPQAAALWNYIVKKNTYQKWNYFPDHKGMQPGRSPHGVFHKVFVNPIGLTAKKPPYPYGTIVVKDNFNKAKKLVAITVMYKVKGFDPGSGDWYWVVYRPGGQVRAAGKLKGCIRCHAGVANKDWVFVHDFK